MSKLSCLAAIPSFELSTKKARTVVPRQILMKDAVFNMSAVALLPHALKYEPALLKDLLNDRFHEPYRAKLIPGFANVKKAALKAGAHGVILSGAGPTMFAFSASAKSRNVGRAMQNAFKASGVKSTVKFLSVDTKGAVVK
jgi:homoserine kinase